MASSIILVSSDDEMSDGPISHWEPPATLGGVELFTAASAAAVSAAAVAPAAAPAARAQAPAPAARASRAARGQAPAPAKTAKRTTRKRSAAGRPKARRVAESSDEDDSDSEDSSASNFSDEDGAVANPKRRTARQQAGVTRSDNDEVFEGAELPQVALASLSPHGARVQGSSVGLGRTKRAAAAASSSVGEDIDAADSPVAADSVSAADSTLAADAVPAPRAAPTDASIRSYQRARAASVKSRAFDLRSLSTGRINTGRTIKPLASWTGLWPPLREFLQNTIDHLDLFAAGGLHPALSLRVEPGGASATTKLAFVCAGDEVCTLRVSADELVVVQHHTFPLHTRALDTGVNDTSKGGEKTAGGFGDGFKTAMVALLALPHGACKALVWDFLAGGRHIRWTFAGARREAVGTFARSTVLEVAITNEGAGEAALSGPGDAEGGAGAAGHEPVPPPQERGENVMVQTYRVAGIGAAFLSEAALRLQVFWTLDRAKLLSISRGDFLGDAASQPVILPTASISSIAAGASGGASRGRASALRRTPAPGVYIRGIWVRKPAIEGALMSFLGKMNVSGRDRNDVDADELLDSTFHILSHTAQARLRQQLLEPLRQPSMTPSWLMATPRFLNQLLQQRNEFFVHDVFGVPRGALFVSKRTTDSKQPFIKWASSFLERRGAPLLPLEPKANKFLFTEVSEAELEERCVRELLADAKRDNIDADPYAATLKVAFKKLFKAVRAVKFTVHFSREVAVAFVHGSHAFVPLQPLSRPLILAVLGIVQRKLGEYHDSFTHLQQAIFEMMPAGGGPGGAQQPIDATLVDAAISRAREVEQEAKAFLGGRPLDKPTTAPAAPADGNGKGKRKATAAPSVVTDLTSDVEEDGGAAGDRAAHKHMRGGGGGSGRGGSSGSSGDGGLVDQRAMLADQIAAVQRAQRSGGAAQVLPASAFEEDGAEATSECLQPASTLTLTTVCAGGGGGQLHADAASVGYLGGAMPPASQAALKGIREALDSAKQLISRALPSLQRLLTDVVCAGYDAANTGYLGSCSQTRIVINLCPLLQRQERRAATAALPADLPHEILLTVVHELAHMLERGGGHGPQWRATQDRLMQAVMAKAIASIGADGAALCQCCDAD